MYLGYTVLNFTNMCATSINRSNLNQEKIPSSIEKYQEIYVDKNQNRYDFHSSVIRNRSFSCFWDIFGEFKGLPPTQAQYVYQLTFRNSVLVLDEVDRLKDPRMKVLETVFRWPKMANMCIIGISNTPDLLQALPKGPIPDIEVLHFRPYNEAEIEGVLSSRLEAADHGRALASAAITQIAKKISNSSGDMRRALEYCQNAMRNVERQGSGKDQVGVMDVLTVMSNEGGVHNE